MANREPQHGWVDTGEVRLHYWDWPGREPTLLCIHGLTGNGRCWDPLADHLGGRYRLIAVDVRGRGLSDKPPAGYYGLAAHARDVAALLRALDAGPAVAVGWSMGAYIVAVLAGDAPELVSHVVLMDGGGAAEGLTEEELRSQGAAAMERLSKIFPSLEAYLDFWRRGAPYIPWSEYFERYLTADVEGRPDGSVVCRSSVPGIYEDLLEAPKWDVEERLPRVQVPALVLWAPMGLVDPARPAFSRATQENVARLLPNGRLVVVEGANHYSIGFSPDGIEQVVAALDSLLNSSG